ncbi:hypothetical protein QA995_43130 [Streptomyces scabiei]|uniref:hypothetical protein n=1 Tax=Streptomyces scabiei TaxID=1930 RepID=UPI001B323EC5|nr:MULTISPECIES: hypothetical protein [Streptomyces]MBP5880701.1 hypothetical protein [Streptomyces sp. LBUM 1477]MDX2871529.1 hypothetical protein [Streptomyces scabiei]MDX3449269.1 hypothetical protein [Streptomyces scabiei]MDX3461268.1 hypothetical protein [Streptomyces scabiei]
MTEPNESTASLFGLQAGPNGQAGSSRASGLAGLVRRPASDAAPSETSPQQTTAVLVPAQASPTYPDPTAVQGTDEERLRALEEQILQAQDRAGDSVRAARNRYIIEVGILLEAIHGDKLYRARGLTWEEYAEQHQHISVRRAGQLIDASKALRQVETGKILPIPPNESQALFLTDVMNTHGTQAAHAVVSKATEDGAKPTAARLKRAATDLGYGPAPKPAEADGEDVVDGEVIDDSETPQTPATDALEAALAAQKKVWSAIPPSLVRTALEEDQERATKILEGLEQEARRTANRASSRSK